MNAVALAAVIISVLSAACATAQQPAGDYNTSDVAYSTGWLPARATWYGAPTGAGPNDNGTCPDCGCLMQQCSVCSAAAVAYFD